MTEKKINIWKISTFVLIILLIVVIVISGSPFSFTTGNAVAEDAVQFINTNLLQGGAQATLNDVSTESGLYKASLSIQGQPVDVYITKDGSLLFPSVIPLESTATNTNTNTNTNTQTVPEVTTKSDKPEIELFVMSHCPFGTQAEKGIYPVVKGLGDKVDFKVKFVYYAMHPSQGEVEEQLNQYCIQEEQNDKYLDYLECFLTAGDGEGCLDEVGIDKTALKTCTDAADADFEITKNLEDKSLWLSGNFPLFNIFKEDNEKYGVGGSPTLVINGEKIDGAPRDSVNLLKLICSAFNNEPSECATLEFEAGTPGPGFGWDTTSAANVAACGV